MSGRPTTGGPSGSSSPSWSPCTDCPRPSGASGGPPPRQEYSTSAVNLFGAGGTAARGATAPAARPSSDLIRQAHDLLIDEDRAERMTAADLAAAVEWQKRRVVGRKNFGILARAGVSKEQMRELGLNWHDAEYLLPAARRPAEPGPAGELGRAGRAGPRQATRREDGWPP